MAKDPAFLFYPGDWISGTMHLTFEEKGAYIELLMLQFNRSHMDIHMVKHMLSHKYDEIWPKIQDKFENSDGKIWNERLRIEIEKRKSYSESRRNNLKSTKKQDTHMSKHMGAHMSKHMENENENENKDKIENKKEDKGVTGGKEVSDSKNRWNPDHPMKNFVISNFPILCRLSEPTYQQCEDILANRTKSQVSEVIEAMANYKGIEKKYTSFIITLRNWLKRRDESQKNTNNQKITENGKIAYPFETKREYEERLANEKLKRSQDKLRDAYRQRIDEGATAFDLGISQEEWLTLRREFGYTTD